MDTARSLSQYEQRLNEVIDYIERGFDGSLSLEHLAGVAHFSPFHFHRLFKAYTGETPAVFVRRLRLQKALVAMERGSAKSLAEVAVESGFAQSSDFSRAFREVYGYPPSHHRKGRVREDSKIQQDIRQGSAYGFGRPIEAVDGDQFQVRVEELPTRRIAYVRVIGATQPARLMAALERLLAWGRRRGIYPGAQLATTSPDNPDLAPMSRYRIDLCMILPSKMAETGRMSFGEIMGTKYAMVHCRGDIHKVEQAWSHLFSTWLPSSGYEPADAPYLELFRDSDDSKGWSILDLDCCVPIRRLA
jgi:AraC family transcriptional regulator